MFLRPFFVFGCHGNTVYQVSLPCVVWYAGLGSEGAAIKKSARGHFFVDSSHGNAEIYIMYQVLPPCIVCVASLRSEEVIIVPEAIFCMVVMEMQKFT